LQVAVRFLFLFIYGQRVPSRLVLWQTSLWALGKTNDLKEIAYFFRFFNCFLKKTACIKKEWRHLLLFREMRRPFRTKNF
jgi:hypothetical protein